METVRKLGLFSPEEKRVEGNFIVDFQYLKGVYERGREGLLQSR